MLLKPFLNKMDNAGGSGASVTKTKRFRICVYNGIECDLRYLNCST